jgi:multicomponent Na+:H+ antiporter subunit D
MSMGAVLHRTGTIKGSELGGLYKSMPWTAGFCIVGAASISAFPLFSGFVSKSLIIAATAEQGYFVPWLILLFASAGVFHHSGIKIPFFAFFAHDSGIRVREAPWNMLAAMAIAAFLCIAIGVFPAPLYALLPYPVDFDPYTAEHVITQLQLLMFSALAFTWLMRTGLYPPELRSVNVDFDVVYRKGLPAATRAFVATFGALDRKVRGAALGAFWRVIDQIYRHYGPGGALARSVSVSNMVLWVMIMLFGYLVISLSGSGVEFGTG